ncbi:MAG TPA: zf-HC2 domain-containing protein [Pyrinomonadaceae bacterium]|nr:zf-HC2 domain-containing protein [Pyrinomonadaceae bacterium]
MFGNHVNKYFSAYAHGELTAVESERVAAHLETCARCREEFEEVKLGIRLAECLPSASAPDSLWEGIESSLARQGAEEKRRRRAASFPRVSSRLSFNWPRAATAGAFACFALLALGGWLYYRSTRPAWEVERLAGAPSIDARSFGETGRLGVGKWLETDEQSRVQIDVANIGQVEVAPNTRVRIVETGLTEHRMELARGTLHARIWAPPRLFFVDTPSAVAADLGCAYTLEVDDAGRSLLRVTSGFVALERGARESIVPAGAACLTQPGVGPGTPFFEDASEELAGALTRFDFEGGGPEALRVVIESARPRDTLTLWHLLARSEGEWRERIYERLAALDAPPEGVTREGILRLDSAMLETWKDRLEDQWVNEDLRSVRKAWRKLWK